jgi:hypothetical protein
MTNLPNLDKRRSALLNKARLLADAGQDIDKAISITTTTMSSLGLLQAKPGTYAVAVELFEQLAAVTICFDIRAAELGPWPDEVETGVVSPTWGPEMCILAESINGRIDFLLDYSVDHGVLETVPRDGLDSYNSLFTVGDRALLESISQELAKWVVS